MNATAPTVPSRSSVAALAAMIMAGGLTASARAGAATELDHTRSLTGIYHNLLRQWAEM